MFPAIVNCTTIDWFSEWPQDALLEVAEKYLQEVSLGSEKQVSLVRFSKNLPSKLWYQPQEGFLVYFHIYLIIYSANIMILLHDDFCIGRVISLRPVEAEWQCSWLRTDNQANTEIIM